MFHKSDWIDWIFGFFVLGEDGKYMFPNFDKSRGYYMFPKLNPRTERIYDSLKKTLNGPYMSRRDLIRKMNSSSGSGGGCWENVPGGFQPFLFL